MLAAPTTTTVPVTGKPPASKFSRRVRWLALFITVFSSTILGFIAFGTLLVLFPGAPIAMALIAFIAGGIVESEVFYNGIRNRLHTFESWMLNKPPTPLKANKLPIVKDKKYWIIFVAISVFTLGCSLWYAFSGLLEMQASLAAIGEFFGVGINVAALPWLFPLMLIAIIITGFGYYLWTHNNFVKLHKLVVDPNRKSISVYWHELWVKKDNEHYYSASYLFRCLGKFLFAFGMSVVTILVVIATAGLNSENSFLRILAFVGFLPVSLIVAPYLTLKTYDKIMKRIAEKFPDTETKTFWEHLKAYCGKFSWHYWCNPFWLLYQIVKGGIFFTHCAAIGLIGGAGAEDAIIPMDGLALFILGTLTEVSCDLGFLMHKDECPDGASQTTVEDDDDEEEEHTHNIDFFWIVKAPIRLLAIGLDLLYHKSAPTKANYANAQKRLFPDVHQHHHAPQTPTHEQPTKLLAALERSDSSKLPAPAAEGAKQATDPGKNRNSVAGHPALDMAANTAPSGLGTSAALYRQTGMGSSASRSLPTTPTAAHQHPRPIQRTRAQSLP